MISEVWVHRSLNPLLFVLVVRENIMVAEDCGGGGWLPHGNQVATSFWASSFHLLNGAAHIRAGLSLLTLYGNPLTDTPSGVCY